MTFIIVGLGNKGKEYERTYHNAGFLFVDWLAEEYDSAWKLNKKIPAKTATASFERSETESRSAGKKFSTIKVVLAKPFGYMNESGQIIKRLLSQYPAVLLSKHLIIAHDDSDLPIGSFKIDSGKGPAGHKGIISVFSALGTNELLRLRIGAREPQEIRRKKAGEFVLKKITPMHYAALKTIFPAIVTALLEHLDKKMK